MPEIFHQLADLVGRLLAARWLETSGSNPAHECGQVEHPESPSVRQPAAEDVDGSVSKK